MPKINTATVFDKAARGWLYKTARKNLWRVGSFYEYEDLVQDGLMIWADCIRRYSDKVTERRHFMALFQRCYGNHLIDLYHARSKESEVYVADNSVPVDQNGNADLDGILPPVLPDAELTVLLAEARFPLRPLVELFYSSKGRNLMTQVPQQSREPINSYLCRLLSIDPHQYDLLALFRSFIAGHGCYNFRERLMPIDIVTA